MKNHFDNDPEYYALKQDIKSKATWSQVTGLLASITGFAALGLVYTMTGALPGVIETLGLSTTGAGILAAGLGITGAGLGYASYRQRLDASMDMEDLEARRHAIHLQMAFGDHQPTQYEAMAYDAGRQRSDKRPWADVVREQQRSAGTFLDI